MRRSRNLIIAISIMSMLIIPGLSVNSIEEGYSIQYTNRPHSRSGVEWIESINTTGSSFMNESHDLLFSFDDENTSFSVNGSGYDPYYDHNSTIREAIDSAPEWLNDSLSWKFHKIWDVYAYKFADLLTNDSIDWRYKDEIAFSISYLPEEVLNTYYVFPEILLENVKMMYLVSSEVGYAEIIDTNHTDGTHSTVNYTVPGGGITLAEEMYYEYLVVPRGSFEYPYYINTTTELQTEPENGRFWRNHLYNSSDPGFLPLREYIINSTNLWNNTVNNPSQNGAIGKVTQWMMDSMVFGDRLKLTNQPIVIYQQHVGMCGEHSYLLTAIGKIALIPTVTVISFEMMHAWNMFYDRGWHVWRAYDGVIDDTYSEGGPGMVSVHTGINPDSSQFSTAPVHTQTSNITVSVKDKNGKPVDGAMVKLDTQPSQNHPMIYGVIADHTGPNGSVTFEVGFGFDYYVQVITPMGQYLEQNATLPLAVPNAVPGVNYTFNVILNQSMTLPINLTMREENAGFGTRFNVTASVLDQVTESARDPLGFGFSKRKDFEDERIWIYFLDNENLSLYRSGNVFYPSGVLNLTEGEEGSIILPGGKDWNIVVMGGDLPLTTSFVELRIMTFRSVVYPEVKIVSPEMSEFILGETIQFKGILEPYAGYMGELSYFWFLDGEPTPVSTEQEFDLIPDLGVHDIHLSIWNSSGEIGRDNVQFTVILPDMVPVSRISSPADGLSVEFGTEVFFSSDGTFDPNGDELAYEWTDLSEEKVISYLPEFSMKFRAGDHRIILNVTDDTGMFSVSMVNISVYHLNLPPVPYISSPVLYAQYLENETVYLSANKSYDPEGDNLSYLWKSSIDGVLSAKVEDNVILSIGQHLITLLVSDGISNDSAEVIIYVDAIEVPEDLPPTAVISSPSNGQDFYVSDIIFLSSAGSNDPEGVLLEYYWFINGKAVHTGSDHSVKLDPGVHVITLEVFDGNHTDSVSITVLVTNRAPVVNVTVDGIPVNSDEAVKGKTNRSIMLDASGSYDPDGSGLIFEWKIDGNNTGSGDRLELNLSKGMYMIILKVTDELGRSSFFDLYLKIEDPEIDIGEDDPDEQSEKRGISETATIFLMILIIILTILIVLVMLKKRSQEEPDDFQIIEE